MAFVKKNLEYYFDQYSYIDKETITDLYIQASSSKEIPKVMKSLLFKYLKNNLNTEIILNYFSKINKKIPRKDKEGISRKLESLFRFLDKYDYNLSPKEIEVLLNNETMISDLKKLFSSDSIEENKLKELTQDDPNFHLFCLTFFDIQGIKIIENEEKTEIKKSRLSYREEKEYLIRIKNGDKEALNTFIAKNQGLVKVIANHYVNCCTAALDYENLVSEGNIGLLNAIENYDSEKGAFSTCASYWIRLSITEAISNTSHNIKLSRNKQILVSKVQKYCQKVYLEENRQITENEIMREFNTTRESARFVLNDQKYETLSLNYLMKQDENEDSFEEFIANDKNLEEEIVDQLFYQEFLAALKQKISSRDFELICDLFGLLDDKKKKQEEIAEKYHITHQRVNEIKKSLQDKAKISASLQKYNIYASKPKKAIESKTGLSLQTIKTRIPYLPMEEQQILIKRFGESYEENLSLDRENYQIEYRLCEKACKHLKTGNLEENHSNYLKRSLLKNN